MMTGHGYGKIILLGEHAVVYGYPALCGALPQGVRVSAIPGTGRLIIGSGATVEKVTDLGERGGVGLPPRAVPQPATPSVFGTTTFGRGLFEHGGTQRSPSSPGQLFSTVAQEPMTSENHASGESRIGEAYTAIRTKLVEIGAPDPSELPCDWVASFDIPVGAGLGASAALSVALVRAINQTLHHKLTEVEISRAVHAGEQAFHGNPSGLDAYLAQHGGFGLFEREKGFTPLPIPSFSLCVGLSGRPKDTRARVLRIAELRKQRPTVVNACLERIASYVAAGVRAAQSGELTRLGEMMNRNQGELRLLEASCEEIDQMCELALEAGALGAKLTGGGGGGCVIALAPGDEKTICSIWQRAGFSSFLASLPGTSSCIDKGYEGRS